MKNQNQNQNHEPRLSFSGFQSKFKKEVCIENVIPAQTILSDEKCNNTELLNLRNVAVNNQWNRDLCVSYIGNL